MFVRTESLRIPHKLVCVEDTIMPVLPDHKLTRPSCLECVEKHLGAAWVILAECRDGYPHRLRVVGHLHEAEDEAQAWPELHNAIRAARAAFQQTGRFPDFVRLALLVGQATAT